MNEELKLRPEVYWFAQQMERKLREHDDRPGWHGEDEEYLFYRLCEEVQELKNFLERWWGTGKEWSECQLIDEAVDVANFAMMLSDNARSAPIPPIAPDPEKQELVGMLRDASKTICNICKILNPQHKNCTSCDVMDKHRAIFQKYEKETTP